MGNRAKRLRKTQRQQLFSRAMAKPRARLYHLMIVDRMSRAVRYSDDLHIDEVITTLNSVFTPSAIVVWHPAIKQYKITQAFLVAFLDVDISA